MTYSTQGARDALTFAGANSVRFHGKHAVMGGFRFRGRQTRALGPVYPLPSDAVASVVGAGLGAETVAIAHNWYAAFACANTGDSTAVLKTMPFLQVGAIQAPTPGFQNVYLFDYAGERALDGPQPPTQQAYNFPHNRLAGTDCLVISDGFTRDPVTKKRTGNNWSGKIARVIGNSTTHIELDLGGLLPGAWLLPAPPGYAHYTYLGSFYYEGEVRNIYDSGTLVKAKMVNMATPGTTGNVGQAIELECDGFISPLATAIVLDVSGNFSTTQTGEFVDNFDADGSGHVVQSARYLKTLGTTDSYLFDNIQIPFLRYQAFWYANSNKPALPRSGGKFLVTGWIEP